MDWLPIAEFADNNKVSDVITVSPFFATRGYNPELPDTGLLANTELPVKAMPHQQRLDTETANQFGDRMNAIHEFVRQ